MVNFKTSNESFLRVSEQLKNNGVNNYDFMLRLNDHTLINVDPNDPNLDELTRNKVKLECLHNIWYYFRECVQITNPNGEKEKFQLTKLTAAMIYLIDKSRHMYVVAHRMSFKTHTAYSLADYCRDYLRRSLWHYEDAEFNKDIYNRFIAEYNDPKNSNNPLLILESVVCDYDTGNHSKIRDLTTTWTDKCYDIPDSELADFYYVNYSYKELVKNPMAFYRYYEIIFNHDYNLIRREILCERKNK